MQGWTEMELSRGRCNTLEGAVCACYHRGVVTAWPCGFDRVGLLDERGRSGCGRFEVVRGETARE